MADYYSTLGLTRSAQEIDIKKSFRKLALKCHPDKNPSDAAAQQFASVAEAYDVLSDPKLKGFYDLYGEEGLKVGLSDGKGGRRGGFYEFSKSPEEVFANFFGTQNPYMALNDIAAQFKDMTEPKDLNPGKQRTFDITLTLEEVNKGCLKKVTHEKKILGSDGSVTNVERTLTIKVPPGCPTGTRFVFEKEGHEVPGHTPGPVIYTVVIARHARFKRKGADLFHTATLPLYKALAGAVLDVETLDGRVLSIPVAEIVTPGFAMTIAGEGLPKVGEEARGDLVVEFDLLFPTYLSETQKMLIKAGFYLPKEKKDDPEVKAFAKHFTDQMKGWNVGFPKD